MKSSARKKPGGKEALAEESRRNFLWSKRKGSGDRNQKGYDKWVR
jgi:hypothetical protein